MSELVADVQYNLCVVGHISPKLVCFFCSYYLDSADSKLPLPVFSFLKEPGLIYPDFLAGLRDYIPYLAFLISIFSALRLANFNVDERQTSSFIGLPVPANALYWGALIVGGKDFLLAHCNVIYLIIMVMLFSWLLVAEIPMFSLKFKNLSWKDNKVSFIFLIVCIPLLLFLGISGFSAVIVWYIILSLLTRKNK